MKIYTEEQIKRAIDIADDNADLLEYDEILSKLTPIELPSDEEIDIQSYIHNPIKKLDGKLLAVSFIEGAKWVIEHIKQQVIP